MGTVVWRLAHKCAFRPWGLFLTLGFCSWPLILWLKAFEGPRPCGQFVLGRSKEPSLARPVVSAQVLLWPLEVISLPCFSQASPRAALYLEISTACPWKSPVLGSIRVCLTTFNYIDFIYYEVSAMQDFCPRIPEFHLLEPFVHCYNPDVSLLNRSLWSEKFKKQVPNATIQGCWSLSNSVSTPWALIPMLKTAATTLTSNSATGHGVLMVWADLWFGSWKIFTRWRAVNTCSELVVECNAWSRFKAIWNKQLWAIKVPFGKCGEVGGEHNQI